MPLMQRGWRFAAPERVVSSTFRALRVHNYRLYYLGQLVSLSGSWMQRVAQAWLVLKLTDSPLALGTVTLLQFAPVTLLSLYGGVVADRVEKRRLLTVTQAVQMVQAAVLAALTAGGQVQLWHVYVLAVVLGLSQVFDAPARQAMMSELVEPEDLPNAVALNSSLFNIARIIGPALAGGAIAAVGMAACFWLNAASYLAVIWALLALRPGEMLASTRPPRGRVWAQLREGFTYALGTRDVCLVIILMTALGAFGFNFQTFVPLLANYVLGVGPLEFGVLFSFLGAGAVTAALLVASRRDATEKALRNAALGFTLLLLLVALSSWFAVTAGLLVLLGAFSTTFSATANTRLQLTTPPELRGRIMSIYSFLFMGTTPIGGLTLGALSERFGVQAALAICAGLCGLGVLGAAVYARRHPLVDPPIAAAGAEAVAAPLSAPR